VPAVITFSDSGKPKGIDYHDSSHAAGCKKNRTKFWSVDSQQKIINIFATSFDILRLNAPNLISDKR